MNVGNLEVYGIIYKIKNIVNNKVYIGQTIQGFNRRYKYKGKDIERVYKYHSNKKKKNENYNEYLLNSIEKYGFNKFEVDKTFDIAFSKEELDIKEKLWIKFFNSTNKQFGYNFDEGGTDGGRSEITKNKLRQYTGKNTSRATPVICLSTNKVFNFILEGAILYNIKASTHIGAVCRGERGYCGKLEDGTKLQWKYISDLNQEEYQLYDIENKLKELEHQSESSKIQNQDDSFLMSKNN